MLGATIALVIGAAIIASVGHAQTPTSVGGAVIWTDQTQYVVGEEVQACVGLPAPGTITLTEILPDNTSRVFFSGPVSATQACQAGTADPPAGTHCLRLDYQGVSVLTTQTCFTVVGAAAPPASSGLTIYTNTSLYQIGDPLTVCYTVPAPGNVAITNTAANGQSNIIYANFDDGSGGCIKGTTVGPAGVECMSLTWDAVVVVPGAIVSGEPLSTQTCYQVESTATTTPAPTGYLALGSAPVRADGVWEFRLGTTLQASATHVRVSSGGCDAAPSAAFVWEAVLQRPSQVVVYGLDFRYGYLLPVGLSASAPNSGFVLIGQPLQSAPPSAIAMDIYGIPQYAGMTLVACVG
jgi:hypothetical protein